MFFHGQNSFYGNKKAVQLANTPGFHVDLRCEIGLVCRVCPADEKDHPPPHDVVLIIMGEAHTVVKLLASLEQKVSQ